MNNPMPEGKWYQNLELNGVDLPSQNPEKKNSRFWNVGKWNNFILPLLPKDPTDMTFVEIGCSTGLFLEKAKEYGFRDVIGIEADSRVTEMAKWYRDAKGSDYKVLNRTVGVDFDFNELPVADVYLLSTVHYYFKLNEWLKFLDQLKTKTCSVIIISRPLERSNHWKPRAEIADIKNYFQDWEKVDGVFKIPPEKKKDPSPRILWSFLFNSKLKRVAMDDLKIGDSGEMVKVSKVELMKEVANNESLKVEETDFYKSIKDRMKHHWHSQRIHNFVEDKIKMLFDIKKNGLREPVIVRMDGKLLDGGHRVAMLKELGYKSVITRKT